MFNVEIRGIVDKVSAQSKKTKDESEKIDFYVFDLWTSSLTYDQIKEYNEDIYNVLNSEALSLKNAIFIGNSIEYDLNLKLIDISVVSENEDSPPEDNLKNVVIQEVKLVYKEGIAEYYLKIVMPQNQSGNLLFKSVKKQVLFTFTKNKNFEVEL